MKKLLLTVLVVLLAAGSAYAVDIEASGSYYVRGKYMENYSLATDSNSIDNAAHYDHDMVLRVNFVQSETTKVLTKIAIRDETWHASGSAATEVSGANPFGRTDDDNIKIERIWLSHTFPTNTKLEAGLMSGGTWAYLYGDLEADNYRIKVTQPLSENIILVGLTEKLAERGVSGTAGTKDTEKDDADGYAIAAVLNFGNISVKPLLYYASDGNTVATASTSDENKTTVFDIGVDGTFGMIGFQAEAIFASVDMYTGKDPSRSSYYVDVWANMDMFKIGGAIGMDLWDEDTNSSFGMGEDWCPLYILTDDVYFGDGGNNKSGPSAANLFLLYGDVNFTDKMSLSAAVGFFTSNNDKNSALTFYKASATEFNVTFAYNITDALTYSIGYGYATVDYDDAGPAGANDPENLQMLYHKIGVSF